MLSLIGNYLLTAFTAGAGFAAIYFPLSIALKWWLMVRGSSHEPSPAGERPETQSHLQADEAARLVAELHNVAIQLTRNLSEHSASVKEVNDELATLDTRDGSNVLDVVRKAVNRISNANQHLTEQLAVAQTTIQEQSALLEVHMADALRDPLTGIANRRAFDHEMSRRFAEWQRKGTFFSLLMIDVDHFKRFNDQHGHQAGDEVLRGVANVIAGSMRQMDLVARYGGEEFAAILPDTELESSKRAADRIREAIASSDFPFKGNTLRVTASVGVAQVTRSEDVASIVRRADEALYASKNAGRNCAHAHTGDKMQRIGDELSKVAPVHREEPTSSAATAQPQKGDPLVDSLTGLPTRIAFRENLERRLAECRRTEAPVSVVSLELDDFETIQQMGETATEFVLDTTGRLLSAATRDMDLVARSGDHTFAIMIPGCGLADAVVPAERVRKAIAACDKFKQRGNMVRFTVSTGVAQISEDENADSLIARAETAMRQAAARGNNRTYIHNGRTCESAMAAAIA